MDARRSYHDSCGVARGLDLVGERWALLIVRELLFGPRRFTDLRSGLPGAGPNVLSQRLRELERSGVLLRRRLAPPAGSWVYELTDWGHELEPVVIGLGTWALGAPASGTDGTLSPVSAMLTLRSYFVPGDQDFTARFELRFDADRYTAEVRRGRLRAGGGPATSPDAVLTTRPTVFVSLLGEPDRLRKAVASSDAEVVGDSGALRRLLATVRVPGPRQPA